MKFSSGIAVLLYWYNYHDLVKNYSIPAIFIQEGEMIKAPYLAPEHFDYPDWWYTWIDVDKVIRKLGKKKWALIIYYFKNIHLSSRGEFYRWRDNERFREMCREIYWALDEDEYRVTKQAYKRFKIVLLKIRERIERGVIDVTKIDPDAIYTPTEVADLLRFSVDTIYKFLNAGKIKGFQASKDGEWRISGQAVLALVNTKPEGVDNV